MKTNILALSLLGLLSLSPVLVAAPAAPAYTLPAANGAAPSDEEFYHLISRNKTEDILQAIANGANPNACYKNNAYTCALLNAYQYQNVIAAKALIDAGAVYWELYPKYKKTLLHQMISGMRTAKHAEIAAYAVSKTTKERASVRQPQSTKQSPLDLAAAGKPELVNPIIDAFLAIGVDPKVSPSRFGAEPIIVAAKKDNLYAVKAFVAKGSDILADNGNQSVPTNAAQADTINLLKHIIESGVDINKTYLKGKVTLLMYACSAKTTANVEYLLSKGADVSLTNTAGQNVLYYAAIAPQRDIALPLLKMLVKAGAKLLPPKSKNAPHALSAAVMRNRIDPEVIKYLLTLDCTQDMKNTALQTAIKQKKTELIDILKAAGAQEQ